MTITITLDPETEANLRADARVQGRAPEEIAAEHLATLYAQEDSLDDALSEALAQVEAGQDRPLEEVAEELRTRFDARYPPSKAVCAKTHTEILMTALSIMLYASHHEPQTIWQRNKYTWPRWWGRTWHVTGERNYFWQSVS